MYSNPVIKGTAPDPSAIRVGEDYYLATSTFDMLPGVTIWHSRDLVDWRVVGHAVSRPSQYRRDGEPGPMVLFAPTIRHHDGMFYVACTNAVPGQGNFLVTTRDITGEWSDAIWIDQEGFDPSLFRDDDGTWYYTRRRLEFRPDGGLGPIVQATIDVTTGELGEVREITAPHGFASNDIEGPHLYRRGDWYYLCSAEGGSWRGHMQTVARSRSPWGPFEASPHTPLLTHRHLVANRIQSLGHAELLDAADGTSWAVALGTRHPRMAQHHNVGREVYLLPVEWIDGWPVAGAAGDGTTRLEVDHPTPAPAPGAGPDVPDTLWTRRWRTVGAAPAGLSATDPDARIVLPAGADPRAAGRASGDVGALLRPQTEDDQAFSATVDVPGPGIAAGIAAYADPTHAYALTVSRGSSGATVVTATRTVDDMVMETSVAVPGAGPVTLRIEGRETAYALLADAGDGPVEVTRGSARLLSAEACQWFVGVHWTLLALGATGSVEFRAVTVEDLEAGAPASPVPF